MSYPRNPLDHFRNFSVHHILMVANSTEAFRPFYEESRNQKELLKNLIVGQENVTGLDAGFYVITDSRKFSYFTLEGFQFETNLTATGRQWTGLITSEINLRIVDATGTALLNYLDYLSKEKLKTSLYHCTFMLYTMFVGHKEDGTTEIVGRQAIPMLLIDLNLSPGNHGAVADVKFAPLNNGAMASLQDYSKCYDINGVKAKSGLLKEAIQDFEDILNEQSRTWYKSLQLVIPNKDGQETETEPSKGFGKLVQFMLTAPETWNTFKVTGVTDKRQETQFKKGGERSKSEPQAIYIGVNPDQYTSIPDVMNLILKQSTDVQKLASNEKREKKDTKVFKIISTVTSDNSTVTVHYDIVEFVVPYVEEKSKSESNQANAFIPTDKNFIEFDYLFSGKNIDILHFDLRLNNVLAMLPDSLNIGDAATDETTKKQKVGNDKTNKVPNKVITIKLHEGDPICAPAKSKTQQTDISWVPENTPDVDAAKYRQQFIQNVGMVHGRSSFDIAMTIRGNPDLISKANLLDLPPHVHIADSVADRKYITENSAFVKSANYLSTNDRKSYTDWLQKVLKEQAPQGDAQSTPMYPFLVKVNIFGQDYNILSKANGHLDPFTIPYQQLWYKGVYHLQKIAHRFTANEFSQDLVMSAVNLDLYGQEVTKKDGK